MVLPTHAPDSGLSVWPVCCIPDMQDLWLDVPVG